MLLVCLPFIYFFLDVLHKSFSVEYSYIFCVEEYEVLCVDISQASSLRWRYRPVECDYSEVGITFSPKFIPTPSANAGRVYP